ncbi:MAG: DsbA family protein [Oligoflexales bacterium]
MTVQKKWISLIVLGLTSFAYGKTLYRHNGDSVTLESLNPSLQQAYYEAEKAHYDALSEIAERDAYDRYLKDLSKKKNKTVEQVETELFAASASDADAKAWFDENKHRLGGRDFDKIKGEIKTFLSYRLKEDGRHKIIEDLKEKKQFSMALTAPQRPTFKITTDGFPSRGPANAKVKIVEFADYQCPHCQRAAEAVKDTLKKFPKNVSMTFLDYPINHSGISRLVAEGAACAQPQGKFWEYHEEAFDSQKTLSKDSPLEIAKKVSLDEKKWQQCMDSGEGRKVVEAGEKEAERLGISGTPTIYINGIKIAGYDPKVLEEEISKALK